MPGSVAQYWSRSLPLTSARLPAETKVDSPRLRLRARSRRATPSDPDWAKKPTRPRPGIIGARLALSRTSESVFTIPRQLGPTTRIPEARAAATSCRSAARPSGPVSPKPPETTTSPRTRLRRQASTTPRDLVRRHGEDGEIDVVGDRLDVGVGGHPADVPRARVDRVDRAGEPVLEQVPQQRVADLAVVVARPHDGDRRGCEQPRDRPGLAALLALVGDGEGVLGLVDRERQVDDAVLVGAFGLVAGVLEDPHHLAVLGQHLGDEALDAALAGGRGEVLEQHRAEPAALVGVLDQEGDLGVVGVGIAGRTGPRPRSGRRAARRRPRGRRGRRG